MCRSIIRAAQADFGKHMTDFPIEGFTPPHSYEAEQAVLGSVLVEPAALKIARDYLTRWDFMSESHGIVFAAFCALNDAGQPIDGLSVEEHLRTHETLDIVGGRGYIYGLMDAPSTSANIEHYAGIVREKSRLRTGMQRAYQFIQAGERGDVSALQALNGTMNLSELVADIRPKSRGKSLTIRKVGRFMADVGKPPPFLVDTILPQNQLILITGKPKHGKSFMALDIADAVSTGALVFGRFKVNSPGPVIYFSMEDSKWTTYNRLERRGVKPEDDRPLYLCTEKFLVNTPQAIEILKREIAGLNPVLIIIDTAAQSIGIKDWSNRGEFEEKMAPLRDFAHEVCTVILIGHNRKAAGDAGDEIAGSNAFTAAVDGWLSCGNKEVLSNRDMQVQYAMDGRDISGSLTVVMDHSSFHFTAMSEEEIAEQREAKLDNSPSVHKTYERYKLVCKEIARRGGKASVAQIREVLEVSYQVTAELVKAMHSANHLMIAGEEKGKGRPTIFYGVHPDSTFYYSGYSEAPIGNSNNLNKNNPLQLVTAAPEPPTQPELADDAIDTLKSSFFTEEPVKERCIDCCTNTAQFPLNGTATLCYACWTNRGGK